MTRKMDRERLRAATTSRRSDRMRTMSAASIATDVPLESAIPTSATTRAGESLIPSPTYDDVLMFEQVKEELSLTIATPPSFMSMSSRIILALPFGLALDQTLELDIPTSRAIA